jgi:hypothetical protein
VGAVNRLILLEKTMRSWLIAFVPARAACPANPVPVKRQKISFLYGALPIKPDFMSPGGDKMEAVHSGRQPQVHEKQQIFSFGTACAVVTLACQDESHAFKPLCTKGICK